jgi:transposase
MVCRLEAITGPGGRRRWSYDDKKRILEETFLPGAVVSAIARRHGLTPQQLFGWRRDARRYGANVRNETPLFVPAVVAPAHPPAEPPPTPSPAKARHVRRTVVAAATGAIELEIDGAPVIAHLTLSQAEIERGMPDEAVEAKFYELTKPLLSRDERALLKRRIWPLDKAGSVDEVVDRGF